MRIFLLLSLLIVMVFGTNISNQKCHCNEPTVITHSCCDSDMSQKSEHNCKCGCDMSHSVAIAPLKIENSQPLHVRTQHINPQTLITKAKNTPLFEPPKFLI